MTYVLFYFLLFCNQILMLQSFSLLKIEFQPKNSKRVRYRSKTVLQLPLFSLNLVHFHLTGLKIDYIIMQTFYLLIL